MKIIFANIAIILCYVLSDGTSVDSVTVDSVWNSDSTWYDGNGVLQQRLSRDCFISFFPQDSGNAACTLKVSLDSGKTWSASPNPLQILNNSLITQFQCGKKGHIKARLLGSDRLNIVFKIVAKICYTVTPEIYGPDTLAAKVILDANNITTISPTDAVCFRRDQRPINTGPYRIVDMRLPNKNISVIPAEIGQLTALENIWLDSNAISAVPPQIGKCKAITFFDLSHNRLTTLPQEMDSLTSLRTLYLSHNTISSLPAGFWSMTTLTTLFLNNNTLTNIDVNVSNFVNLQRLDISHNQITSLPATITQLPNMQSIVVDYNKLCGVSQPIADFISIRYGDTTWKTTQTCP